MLFEQWKFVVGTAAALCTTIAFVPQLIKIYRRGGRDLSYSMLCLYLAGVLLWLAYGLMIRATAVIVANAAATGLVAACIGMKAASDGGALTRDGIRRRTGSES